MRSTRLLCVTGALGVFALAQFNLPVGIFESAGDVGVNPKPGAVDYVAAAGVYRVMGGGANIWGTADAFYFLSKRITGDVTITADVQFLGAGVDPHRKAVLMVRQDRSAGAAYADIAVHGDGLTSLQFRPGAGLATQEIKSAAKAPTRLRLERKGNQFTAYVGRPDGEMVAVGPQAVELADPVLVGIGVSSHNADVLETAMFTNVRIEQPAQAAQPPRPRFRSKVAVFDLKSKESKLIYQADDVVEAPNWSRDGKFLLINTGGSLYRLPLDKGDQPPTEKVNLGDIAYRCNNDHDFSRDGARIAFSASSPTSRQSQVYTANSDGSGVKLMTPAAPSYFHGWSPDGQWLAFVGQRDGKFELFRAPSTGGEEQRLTSAGAYDDGPEYSPDGKWIYFNSNRGGGWNIWRMPSDGAGPKDVNAQQVTDDEWEDWFPHFSPNGKHMLVFSFPKGTTGHNDRMEGVALRIMKAPGKKVKKGEKIEILTKFFGGQGTINVNSWSPDSKKFAYVIYEPLPAK